MNNIKTYAREIADKKLFINRERCMTKSRYRTYFLHLLLFAMPYIIIPLNFEGRMGDL